MLIINHLSNKIQGEMNCSSATSYQDKIKCTITDMIPPFIIALIIGLGGIALTAKLAGG